LKAESYFCDSITDMKNLILAIGCLLSIGAFAQNNKPKTSQKPPVKTTTQAGPLKNKLDSVSYAIGFMVANFYKNQQGIQNLNSAMVAKAVNDIYSNKKTLLNEAQSNAMLMRYLNPALDKNIAEGEAFLKANKKKPGVKTTVSGLQYEVMVQGTGIKPAATDTIVAHYAGTLVNGTEFESSYKRGTPITYPANQLIKGWTEALQMMPAGSKYKLYIPYDLAYGLNDQGPAIPGGSVLIFELELLEVRPKK
jgi:FKBP-type peptidyl-prolyl cis-trans isomerase FklB